MGLLGAKNKNIRLAGVVLSQVSYREADLIVTFLTREMGLVSGLARYARRSRRRFGGGLLSPGTAAWYDLTVKPHSELVFVENAEVDPKAPQLPPEPVVQGLAGFALELVRGFETPGNPATESFRLLLKHLARLSKCGCELSARKASLDFAFRYMELAGFAPHLNACLVCGRPADAETGWFWDPIAGGIYCPDCFKGPHGTYTRPISSILLSRLALREGDPEKLSADDLEAAEYFFENLAANQLGRPLRSLKIARSIFTKTEI